MNNYITGAVIKELREKNHLTQQQLAEKLCVSDKAISKWETGKGFPDISLIEPLANVLQVSIPELLSGEQIIKNNRFANILRSIDICAHPCYNVRVFTRRVSCSWKQQPDKAQIEMSVPCSAFLRSEADFSGFSSRKYQTNLFRVSCCGL